MATEARQVNVLITSYLEPEYVEQVREVDPRLNVLYEQELLRPPRYPADHTGQPRTRTPEQEARWQRLLGQAEVLFDFDVTNREELPELAPGVRWIQGTSAGIGQLVKQYGYDHRMPQTIFTTASGVHAQPLAEFCLLAILMFTKQVPRMLQEQSEKQWSRYATTDLAGRTLGIIGVGKIGREVARVARAFGMRVIGTKRQVEGVNPSSLFLDALYPPSALGELLAQSEFLVLVAPHTSETEKLLGAKEFAMLPRGAFFINIGRGATVDEAALIEALRSHHLGGAALDVFETEPLPPPSPLWEMPNVLVSPHSASTSDRENQRITALFCENLRRYLAGEPLLNVLDTEKLY